MAQDAKNVNVAANSLPGSQAATEVELGENDRRSSMGASSAIIDVEEYCKLRLHGHQYKGQQSDHSL
jgi:hypothetical protein